MSAEIKRGMLIRNLRNGEGADVVLAAKRAKERGDAILVASKGRPGVITQYLTLDAEIRWPWDPESAWRRVIG